MTGNDAGSTVGRDNAVAPHGAPGIENSSVAPPATAPRGRDNATHSSGTEQDHDQNTSTRPATMTRRDSRDNPSQHRRTSTRKRDSDATDRGGKVVAWAGFIFGSVLSILMNWLHTWLPAAHNPPGWSPGIWPQIGSAVWPVFLLLSVEALARVRWRRGPLWGLARYGGVGAVAAGSAVISYGHVYAVLESWDYGTLGASVGPLVLDGLMVTCGFALLAEADAATADQTVPTRPPRAEIISTAQDPAAIDPTATTPDRGPHPFAVDLTPAVRQPDATDPAVRDNDATTSDTTDATERDIRILELHRRGLKTRPIAEKLGVHHSTVARVVARHYDSDTATTSRPTATGANGQRTQP